MATSLPSAALPASGSRGLQYHTGLSAKRLPRIFFLGQNKTRPSEVNNVRICSAPVSGAILGVSRNALQARKNAGENLSRGLRGRFVLHVRVKDGLPFSLLFLPDGGGIVGTRLVFPVVCAFNGHLVSRDNCARSVGSDFVVADRERFHVPLLHVRQFLLHVGHAFGVNSHHVCRDELLEVVRLFVLKRLPCRFFFFHQGVVGGCGRGNGNRRKQHDHCVSDIFFHYVLSLGLSAEISLLYSSRRSSRAMFVEMHATF